MMKKNMRRCLAGSIIGMIVAGSAGAGNLSYEPLSPGLGGDPNLNGYLVGTAQIQNQFTESGGGGGGGVPDISFPPIVIDLGGLDDNPTSDPVVPPVAPAATQTNVATQPLLRQP